MAKTSMILKQQKEQKYSTRKYNRCKICGRPHAYLRKYGICRICFRELAYKGETSCRSGRPDRREGLPQTGFDIMLGLGLTVGGLWGWF